MKSYSIYEEEFPDPKADPLEDYPPSLAVLGFRPSDYNAESFRVGLRVRWVKRKSDKKWLDGFITEVDRKLVKSGCVITIYRVGKIKQDTYDVVQFPLGVHEIHLPPVEPHLQLSNSSLQQGFSISFYYNGVWILGWVIKLEERTCLIEFLKGGNTNFLRSKMKELTFVQIPRKFVYGGNWKGYG